MHRLAGFILLSSATVCFAFALANARGEFHPGLSLLSNLRFSSVFSIERAITHPAVQPDRSLLCGTWTPLSDPKCAAIPERTERVTAFRLSLANLGSALLAVGLTGVGLMVFGDKKALPRNR